MTVILSRLRGRICFVRDFKQIVSYIDQRTIEGNSWRYCITTFQRVALADRILILHDPHDVMWLLEEVTQQLRSAYEATAKLCYNVDVLKYSLLGLSDGPSTRPGIGRSNGCATVHFRTRRVFFAASATLLLVILTFSDTFATGAQTRNSTGVRPSPSTKLLAVSDEHPIQQLVRNAEVRHQSLRAAQSTTLHAAITEYQRRYKMPPPPHFDRWYEYAVQHDTELIDEFDAIHDSLVLFWGVNPDVIRQRTREALGYDNSLMEASIRGGEVQIFGSGQDDFQVPVTQEMISKFSQWLPDMDLAFNVNDESRVLVPHEDVTRLMSLATTAILSVRPVTNAFSRSSDLGNGETYHEQVAETPFNRLDHQQTFAHSSMSCPPDSPSRSLDPIPRDAKLGFEFEGITFVDNITAFSDICLTPSVRRLIGQFNHPNVYAVSHELVPVFTPSKLSTFHDILYPSPYYYAERTRYDDESDVQWEQKTPSLYWRGATSGGYSEGGTWRTLLRQSILSKLVSPGTTLILTQENNKSTNAGRWTRKYIERSAVAGRYDTKFTEIKQCAPEDCVEMLEYFGMHDHAPQEEPWKSRYLLDMDGNALSGRFYALLKSWSLPFKVAYYHEWHTARIFPWKHYVPLSSTTDEYAEVLRYFEEEDEGQHIAKELASQGREWVNKVARKVDMEVYMFRLLLE